MYIGDDFLRKVLIRKREINIKRKRKFRGRRDNLGSRRKKNGYF